MTNDANPSPSPGTPAQEPGLVAFADCELVAINQAMMLVINRQNGKQQIMAPQVVEALKTCTTFRPLAEHAAHLAATRPELQGKQEMAAGALANVEAGGMLLDAADICTRLGQNTEPAMPPTRVFVSTCDRPEAVERLLESMLRAGNLSRHNALFLVDDSRDPANRAANREAVIKFNLRSAKDMFYIGAEAQQELITGLVEQLPTHETGIRFLLDASMWQGKKTYGRSRTLCLLFSVGYRAIMMDDDVLCQAVLPPISEPGIGIGSGGMRKAAFYATEAELSQSGQPAAFDPLSEHASLLGSSLAQCLNTLNQGPLLETQLQNVNAALANVLRADSPVLVTQCGSLGDPGTGSAHWGQMLGEDSVARLVSAPHGIDAALQNRLNWLGSSRPNIFKMPFMSQITGVDNSHLLPPYFPAFRGEDVLFGAMLVSMHPQSVALEYPWSVPHLPMEARTFDLSDPGSGGGGIPLLARYLTERINYNDATDPEHQLRSLAQEALRIAARSDANLLLDYRTELARAHADKLYALQNQFTTSQKLGSADWQGYIQQHIEQVQRYITTPQSPTDIAGLPENMSEEAALNEFRRLARGFAAAMDGWVEMRTAAAALTEALVNSRKILPL